MTVLVAAQQFPTEGSLPSREARLACRNGMASSTAASPTASSRAISRSCRRSCGVVSVLPANPKPCPIIGMSDVGDPRIPALGHDLDIRTDVLRYRVWWTARCGGRADRHHGALARRSRRLRARLLVLIRRGADGGRSSDPPHRARGACRCTAPISIAAIWPFAGPWWCRCGRSNQPDAIRACRSPRAFPPCMAPRFISAIRHRSASPISQSPTTAIRCRSRPTKFRCSGRAA